MIISISYNVGDSTKSKYFDGYDDAFDFIRQLQEVLSDDFLHFDFYIYIGKEEERVRKIKDDKNKNI